MRIFVTGATGFIGGRLVQRLLRDRHLVVAWVRDPGRAAVQLGSEVELLATDCGTAVLSDAIARCDAVVNLAGSPVATRWTAARRDAILASRIGVTRRIVAAIGVASPRPRVLVSASAIGFYGDRGADKLDERSPAGSGFLADVCREWEARANAARDFGVRTVNARLGVVLGLEGGALAEMLPAFRLGLGARLGDGHQWFPWIHLDDAVELLSAALVDPAYEGPINVVAPGAVSNRGFTRALGCAVSRSAWLALPRWVLRLALGGAAASMLASTRVVPQRALALGFDFAFPTVDGALVDLVGVSTVAIEPVSPQDIPDAGDLLKRRPTYVLHQRTRVAGARAEVFAFFGQAENLGPMTPAALRFEIVTPTPISMAKGTQIVYRIRLGPIRFSWTTLITRWQPNDEFSDSQVRGPYRAWHHRHEFITNAGGTEVVDRVFYALPFGWLGRVVHWLAVGPLLRRIFEYRRRAMLARFGPARAIPERSVQ